MKMRHAFLVRDLAPIAPLGAPAADAWLLGGRLHERMRTLLEAAGLTVERVASLAEAEAGVARSPGGAIVSFDSVAFSAASLRGLIAALGDRRGVRAALPVADATTRMSHIGGLDSVVVDGAPAFAAPFYALAAGATIAEATTVLLPFKEQLMKVPTAVGMMGRGETRYGVTDSYLVRVDHWAHILRLNQVALVGEWIERWQRPAGRLWYLWRALLGFPWRRGRLLTSIRRIHPGARVHHTAHVDTSVVEAGAEIGAHAVVRASWIGKGARIDDGAVVQATVVGDGASVGSGSTVSGSVLYPRSLAAQHKMQMSVLGEAAVAFTGSYFYDLNFDRNVHVAHRGRIVDAGDRFLSVCLGPWARVAGGVWVASGREIPAGALIVQPPERVLHRVDEELASRRMVSVADRGMVDIGALPSNRPDGEANGR